MMPACVSFEGINNVYSQFGRRSTGLAANSTCSFAVLSHVTSISLIFAEFFPATAISVLVLATASYDKRSNRNDFFLNVQASKLFKVMRITLSSCRKPSNEKIMFCIVILHGKQSLVELVDTGKRK